jgi:hypothetical protein
MFITAASRAVLVLAVGALAFTVGAAAAKSRYAAKRDCMALARAGTHPSARPSLANKKRRAAVYNECMERAGFGRGPAGTK